VTVRVRVRVRVRVKRAICSVLCIVGMTRTVSGEEAMKNERKHKNAEAFASSGKRLNVEITGYVVRLSKLGVTLLRLLHGTEYVAPNRAKERRV
jgi:hypothetical protein